MLTVERHTIFVELRYFTFTPMVKHHPINFGGIEVHVLECFPQEIVEHTLRYNVIAVPKQTIWSDRLAHLIAGFGRAPTRFFFRYAMVTAIRCTENNHTVHCTSYAYPHLVHRNNISTFLLKTQISHRYLNILVLQLFQWLSLNFCFWKPTQQKFYLKLFGQCVYIFKKLRHKLR